MSGGKTLSTDSNSLASSSDIQCIHTPIQWIFINLQLIFHWIDKLHYIHLCDIVWCFDVCIRCCMIQSTESIIRFYGEAMEIQLSWSVWYYYLCLSALLYNRSQNLFLLSEIFGALIKSSLPSPSSPPPLSGSNLYILSDSEFNLLDSTQKWDHMMPVSEPDLLHLECFPPYPPRSQMTDPPVRPDSSPMCMGTHGLICWWI